MGRLKLPFLEKKGLIKINGFTNLQIKKLGGTKKIKKFCAEFLNAKLTELCK